MRDVASAVENRLRQEQRWERAIFLSIVAVVASGILGIAAQDAFFHQPIRRRSFTTTCICNLRAIDGAKATWALEYKKKNSDIPTDVELFGPKLYMREKPLCPAGGTYIIRAVDKKPRCTIPGHTI